MQPRGRALVLDQRTHTTSLRRLAETENPSRWVKSTINEVCCPKLADPRQVGARRLLMQTPTYLTASPQKNVHELIVPSLHSSLPASRWGAHSFEGIRPMCPPLPGKAIKLFFSTSPRTLSWRFTPVAGYSGQLWQIQVQGSCPLLP